LSGKIIKEGKFEQMLRIGLIGDYDQEVKAHVAIPKAIQLAANELGCQVEVEWIATPTLEQDYAQKLEN
jgi:CTP synthase (UTP-ammonia lyase)